MPRGISSTKLGELRYVSYIPRVHLYRRCERVKSRFSGQLTTQSVERLTSVQLLCKVSVGELNDTYFNTLTGYYLGRVSEGSEATA